MINKNQIMKTIELKKVKEKVVVNNSQQEAEIKTIDLLKVAINAPSQGGYSVSEMSQRLKLLDVVDQAEKSNEDKVSFEDSDFEVLKKLVKDTKWAIISRTVVDFVTEFDKQ